MISPVSPLQFARTKLLFLANGALHDGRSCIGHLERCETGGKRPAVQSQPRRLKYRNGIAADTIIMAMAKG